MTNKPTRRMRFFAPLLADYCAFSAIDPLPVRRAASSTSRISVTWSEDVVVYETYAKDEYPQRSAGAPDVPEDEKRMEAVAEKRVWDMQELPNLKMFW